MRAIDAQADEMVLDEMPGAVVLQYSVLGRSAGTATH